MRVALDQSNYQTTTTTTTKSIPDRTKSAPHFGGVHRKVTISFPSPYLGVKLNSFSVTSQTISAST
jgi:hypothetical protein